MNKTIPHARRQFLAVLAGATLAAGCAEDTPVAPTQQAAMPAQLATVPATETDGAIATLQRVTARYQDLRVAFDEKFVLLHECENRPGEGPVGIVYVNFERLLDGRIDPSLPDALIYELGRNGRPKLAGVEFAIPNTGQEPPTFLGNTFQREDEFGVFALHIWVWTHNPEGLFAETNPRVSCGAE